MAGALRAALHRARSGPAPAPRRAPVTSEALSLESEAPAVVTAPPESAPPIVRVASASVAATPPVAKPTPTPVAKPTPTPVAKPIAKPVVARVSEAAIEAQLSRVIELGNRLRREHPDRKRDVNELTVSASVVSRSDDRASALAQLKTLEAKLQKLDKP